MRKRYLFMWFWQPILILGTIRNVSGTGCRRGETRDYIGQCLKNHPDSLQTQGTNAGENLLFAAAVRRSGSKYSTS